MTQNTERWVSMKEAAREMNVSPSMISRLGAIKAIEVRTRRADRRLRLVNIDEVKRVLNENS